MDKPIEEGCRAVIVNSQAGNDGIIVTVGAFIGTVEHTGQDDVWEVDRLIRWSDGRMHYLCREVTLQRIDDYDGNKTTTWESMKDIWSPETIEQ